MSGLPTVTAIVAAYNYADYLPRTLDSALNQDYPKELLDIVVVDDGSKDNTQEVLADYVARYPGRITNICQENAGYVTATNVAIENAAGDLLAILDADDLWPADKTRKQVSIFNARPEVGLVYSDTELIDAHDRSFYPSFWRWMGVTEPATEFTDIMGNSGNAALASAIMMRRSLAEHYAPIPAGVPWVDWWVTARCAQFSKVAIERTLKVGYRMHGGNLTLGATGHLQVREMMKVVTMRRLLLKYGAGDVLSLANLIAAHDALERFALGVVKTGDSAFLPPQLVTSDELARAAELTPRIVELAKSAEYEQAFRLAIEATGNDPYNGVVRDWLQRLERVCRRMLAGEPAFNDCLDGVRSTTIMAELTELVREPQMLSEYCKRISPGDDVTLVLDALGIDDDKATGYAYEAIAAAGLVPETLPDVVLVTDAGAGGRMALEQHTDALYTRRKAILAGVIANPADPDSLTALGAAPV